MIRGLGADIWRTIEQCWAQNPAQRLPAAEVVERLRTLPSTFDDTRPPNEFAATSPIELVHRQANHPFPPLIGITGVLEIDRLPEFKPIDRPDASGDEVGAGIR